MSNEPRTAAGRELLDLNPKKAVEFWPVLNTMVLAIEAEARESAPDSEALALAKWRLERDGGAAWPMDACREEADRLVYYLTHDEAGNAAPASVPPAPAPRTLAELQKLAEPLNARVITQEALKTWQKLNYEMGRVSTQVPPAPALDVLRTRVAEAVLLSAAQYDIFQGKASHEKLRLVLNGVSDYHLARLTEAAEPSDG